MDDKLQKFLESMGEKSQEAWAVLAQEQAIYSSTMAIVCFIVAGLFAIMAILCVTVVEKKTGNEGHGILIGAILVVITLVTLFCGIEEYVEGKTPNKTLFDKVIRIS